MKAIDFVQHPSICALPWTGIYVNPDGMVKNCAIIHESLGNLHAEPLKNLIDNERSHKIRQDMLDGTRHRRCTACYSVEDNSGNARFNESNRSYYRKIAIKHVDTDIFDSADRFQMTILDLRWKNTCNRACIYCGPDLSSLWQDLLAADYSIDEDVLEQNKTYVDANLKHVKHVYLAGGEPLLIKENQFLLERLLTINPEVDIRINSNIGSLDTPVYRLLSKFPNVHWTISVDSQGAIFEYMRWPGKWPSFLQNLDRIRSDFGDNINFNMVWCILNGTDILATIDMLIARGYHENMFVVQCLTSPTPLSVLHLPAAERHHLKTTIEQRRQSANPNFWLYKSLSSMYNFLDTTLNDRHDVFCNKIPIVPGLAGTFKFLQDVDQLRMTDSREIFPDLYTFK